MTRGIRSHGVEQGVIARGTLKPVAIGVVPQLDCNTHQWNLARGRVVETVVVGRGLGGRVGVGLIAPHHVAQTQALGEAKVDGLVRTVVAWVTVLSRVRGVRVRLASGLRVVISPVAEDGDVGDPAGERAAAINHRVTVVVVVVPGGAWVDVVEAT